LEFGASLGFENCKLKIMNLFIVATPIGNLKDITLRALEIFKSVDLILAEDTRVTSKLLSHYKIQKPLKTYHEHSGERVCQEIKAMLEQGQNIALVTDAGTPGIADPAGKLIQFIRQNLPAIKIVPIPGPSALITALSVAGIPTNRFTFLGYPPHKKGRQTFFAKFAKIKIKPIVFYESRYRLQKALDNLAAVFESQKEIIIASELTKMFEDIFQGNIAEAKKYFVGKKGKGEFVIIVP